MALGSNRIARTPPASLVDSILRPIFFFKAPLAAGQVNRRSFFGPVHVVGLDYRMCPKHCETPRSSAI